LLRDRTVAIAGVGPGLGREVAALALREGARVVAGARNRERLLEIAAELDPDGGRILTHPLDVTDADSCADFARAAFEHAGRLDALVHVAALDALFGTLENTSAEDWRRSFEVNVLGTVQMVRACVPHLRATGGGAVVLVGSQSMWLPPRMPQIAYASAKGALVSAMGHMVRELGPHRIRVNMVVPTWMWGPPVQAYVRWQARSRGISEQEVVAEITAQMPLGEIPADEDVAEAAVFLCSQRARMITGETLMVNAGELVRI